MLPVTELRATIPLAIALGIPLNKAFVAAYLGNIIPAPFILLLLEPFYRRWRFLANFVNWSFRRTSRNRTRIEKYGLWGLFFFIAVPLPGTGVWTGSLLASIFRLPFWPSLVAITAGAFLAAVLVSLAAMGIFKLANLFSWVAVFILLLAVLLLRWFLSSKKKYRW